MLNDQQHEQLKKLVTIALGRVSTGYIHDSSQRHHAMEDIADIVDPEHWLRGQQIKPRR